MSLWRLEFTVDEIKDSSEWVQVKFHHSLRRVNCVVDSLAKGAVIRVSMFAYPLL